MGENKAEGWILTIICISGGMRNSNATRTLEYHVFYIMPNNGGFCPKEQSVKVQLHSSTSKSKPQALPHLLAVHSCSLPCSSWAIPAKRPAKKKVAVAAASLAAAVSALCGMGERAQPCSRSRLPAPCAPTAGTHGASPSRSDPGFVGWPATLRPFPLPRVPCRSSQPDALETQKVY